MLRGSSSRLGFAVGPRLTDGAVGFSKLLLLMGVCEGQGMGRGVAAEAEWVVAVVCLCVQAPLCCVY